MPLNAIPIVWLLLRQYNCIAGILFICQYKTLEKNDWKPEKKGENCYFTKQCEREYKKLGRPIPVEDESAGEVRQAMMKQLMLRMVTTQGGKLAKRPVPTSELKYPNWRCRYKDATYRMCQVIDQLIKERLIVSYSSEFDKDGQKVTIQYVEPAHDALILYWDKLHKKDEVTQEEQHSKNQEQGWLEEEEENLVLRERLIAAIQDWQEHKPEEKEIKINFFTKFKHHQQRINLPVNSYEKLDNSISYSFNIYKRLSNFIDYFIECTIELEMRFKILEKIVLFFLKLILFFLSLISIISGLFLIFLGLFFLAQEFILLFPDGEYFLLFTSIFLGFFVVSFGLFVFSLGLLFFSRKLSFKILKFLIISICWNLIRCFYRLLKKTSQIIFDQRRRQVYNLSKRNKKNGKQRKVG